jgi:hypothetical protein
MTWPTRPTMVADRSVTSMSGRYPAAHIPRSAAMTLALTRG